MAVFCLPEEMFGFFKKNIHYLESHAPDPDKRRYAVKGEAPRHYIDIDHYGPNPFDVVPVKWKDAIEKFSEDTLMAYGIVPWHIPLMVSRLTQSFKAHDRKAVLKIAAELGHYVGDAHVPLHTTENYNGQLTGQHGIHGLWESRLPELFGHGYDYFAGKAVYIESVSAFAWEMIRESHGQVDSVLMLEKRLTENLKEDEKFSIEQRGQTGAKVYSHRFSKKYHEMLQEMVERKMQKAIFATASLWYTAWVDAGQPELPLEQSGEENPEEVRDTLKLVSPMETKGHEE